MRRLFAVAFVLSLVGAPVGVAQVWIGAAGDYVSFGGDDFSGTEAGYGGEVNVLFPIGSLKLGAGAQYTTHGAEGLDGSGGVLGVLAEGRYMFTLPAGKVTPYIGARGGWVRTSSSDFDVDLDGTADDVSSSGFAFGGGGGIMISLSPGLALDIGAIFHSVSLGDAEVNGTTVPQSDLSGTALQIRGGISFRLGGGL